MADSEGIWTRGGVPVEELPDPLAPEWPVPPSPEAESQPELPKKRRRRWPIYLYSITGMILLTLVWLIFTAPLSRALEPLDDPALLLLSYDGHSIA